MIMTKVLLGGVLATQVVPQVLAAIDDNTIGGFPVVGLTAPTIIFIAVIMLMRGDIVAGKVHRERVDEIKQDRDYWRSAHGVSEEARETALRQVDELVEGFKTVEAIANGIRQAAREG